MRRVYREGDKEERGRLAVLRSNFKRNGLIVPADRVRLVNAVLMGCNAMLRQLPPKEQRQILRYILKRTPTA